MSSKIGFAVCFQLFLLKGVLSQLVGGGINGAVNGGCNCGASIAKQQYAPISGGSFLVSSQSPISPTGLYVVSENTIEGTLGVNGQVPFLAAVTLEGAMDSKGQSEVEYKCGDCNIGITSENAPAAAAPGYAGGLGAGPYPGAGCAGGLGAGAYPGAGYGGPLGGFGAGIGPGLGGALGAGFGPGLGGGLGAGCGPGFGY